MPTPIFSFSRRVRKKFGTTKVWLVMAVCCRNTSSVKPPVGLIVVNPALKCVPERDDRPAGLKNTAEPSPQGLAATAPPRAIVQVDSSYTPNPCAPSAAGMSPTASTNAVPRIRSVSGCWWGDGERGWKKLGLAPTLVKPNDARSHSALPRDVRRGTIHRGIGAGPGQPDRRAHRLQRRAGAPDGHRAPDGRDGRSRRPRCDRGDLGARPRAAASGIPS